MACRVKPYFFPDVWMIIGGFKLAVLKEKSLLGDESREEGLEDSERGEMGLGWRPLGESSETNILKYSRILISTLLFQVLNLSLVITSSASQLFALLRLKSQKMKLLRLFFALLDVCAPAVMMRDRAETDADLGTFPPQGSLCLSGVSSWLPKRRGPAGSLGDECLAPVLLLRIRILRRFDTTTSAADDKRRW